MSFEIQQDVSVALYTTFRVGGRARFFAEVKSEEEALEAFSWARERQVRIFVLGRGSNILFPDGVFDGLVLLMRIAHLKIDGNLIRVGSGYSFAHLGVKTSKLGLSGLEFAVGIPGSVGGAVVMNAGANGQETARKLKSVRYLTEDGEIVSLESDELEFGYRSSPFQARHGLILEAMFELHHSPEAKEVSRSFLRSRHASQPYSKWTAGCCFRNPEGGSAGALIESCGLKGAKKGGARVSMVHANFIENAGEASARDVRDLIEHIQQVVYEKKNICLQTEVKIIE